MDYLSTPVYYYKGYIYMVRVDAGMAKVVRIQKDGSKREDVAELFANDGVTSISMVFMVTAYMLMIIWDIQQVMKSEKKLLKDRFKDWTIRRSIFI